MEAFEGRNGREIAKSYYDNRDDDKVRVMREH